MLIRLDAYGSPALDFPVSLYNRRASALDLGDPSISDESQCSTLDLRSRTARGIVRFGTRCFQHACCLHACSWSTTSPRWTSSPYWERASPVHPQRRRRVALRTRCPRTACGATGSSSAVTPTATAVFLLDDGSRYLMPDQADPARVADQAQGMIDGERLISRTSTGATGQYGGNSPATVLSAPRWGNEH